MCDSSPTFSDSAIMKQSLLHKRLLTTVNTSGRYVHKKDIFIHMYMYVCILFIQ